MFLKKFILLHDRYLNFLVRGKKFLGLFYHWANTSLYYEVPDRHLKRDVTIITLLILTSAIMENAILHLEYIPALDFISGNFNYFQIYSISSILGMYMYII